MKKIRTMMRKSVLLLSGVMLTALFLTSCLKDNDNNNNSPVAGLMAMNLSSDGVFAGFALSGNSITPNPLAFNSYTGGYLSIYPGSRQVESYNFSSGGTLATDTYNFDPEKYYSVFLVSTDSNYENVIVRDAFDSLASTSQAFVRYVNAIPDATSPMVTISVNGTNMINEHAAFKAVSDFVAVDAGEAMVSVNNEGMINASRTITLEPQKIYTILLAGKPGATGDTAVQVKYILNGTADENTGRQSSASSRSVQ